MCAHHRFPSAFQSVVAAAAPTAASSSTATSALALAFILSLPSHPFRRG
jgi:hypothetical protein